MYKALQKENTVESDVLVELSFQSLFMSADAFVKAVLIILVAMSVWSIAIIAERWWALWCFRRELKRFMKKLRKSRSLETLQGELITPPPLSAAALFKVIMGELDRSTPESPHFIQNISRIVSMFAKGIEAALERRLVHLATIGAIAPFIGLLGTVWGIMNSFQAIAISGETHLAVVAPGVAEALFATALGLFAAIPALMFYNKFSSDVAAHVDQFEHYAARMELFMVRREPLNA